MARSAVGILVLGAVLFLLTIQRSPHPGQVVVHASATHGQRPTNPGRPLPQPRTAVDALNAVRVAVPERPEIVWLHNGPTTTVEARRAAKVYFPDMFAGAESSLPDRFDVGSNPCWGRTHCLPSFLILGVYQAGVRDLYTRLSKHAGVAQRSANSPSFYSQVHPTWTEYVRSLGTSSSQALDGRLLGEASAVTFHFVWVHQEKLNQPCTCHQRTNVFSAHLRMPYT